MPVRDAAGAPADLQFFYAEGHLRIAWDPGSVPAGYRVDIEFLSAGGVPVDPQPAIESTDGGATVTDTAIAGTAIAADAPFYLRARVVAPWAPQQWVVVHDIPAVTNLAIAWRAGALHVTGNEPPGGPYTYQGEARDADGVALAVQPPIEAEGSAGLRVDGAALVDGATYRVAVRATRDGSRGPWTVSPPCRIDKSLPDSPVLQGLLARLREAIDTGSGSFGLTPQLIGSAAVSSLFGELLGAADDSLTLANASIASSSAQVTLDAQVTYPAFGAAKTSRFAFVVDGEEQLVLSLSTTESLGAFTIDRLIATGIVPRSPYDAAIWAGALAPLPSLSLSLDSAAGVLAFGGDPTAESWNVSIGLVDVGFGTVEPELRIVSGRGATLKQFGPRVRTNLCLGADTAVPIFLQLPYANGGWVAALAGETRIPIGDLANFNPLMGGANSALPASVVGIGDFSITSLSLGFAPIEPQVWNLRAGFALGPSGNGTWRVVDGLIEIEQLRTYLDLTLYRSGSGLAASAMGSISGSFKLAERIAVDVGINLPAGPDGLTLVGSAMVDDFSLASLAGYLGGSATPLTGFLERFGTVGSLGLRTISMRFVSEGEHPTINALSVGLELSSWTIPSLPWFAIDEVYLDLDVERPLDGAHRLVTGLAGGRLALGDFRLNVDIDFTDPERWTLDLKSTAAVLPSLDPIGPILPTGAIAQFVPSGLQTQTTYGLAAFALTYNTQHGYVETVDFALDSGFGWSWLSGLLTLWEIRLDLHASWASASASLELTGSISGDVGISDATFRLSAARPTAGDHWTFSGALLDDLEVDFNAILQGLGCGLRLPSGYGFPTAITIEVADLSVVPETGQLDFRGSGLLDWRFDLGPASLAMEALGGELHFPAGAGDRTGRVNGRVNGRFSFGPVVGFAQVALGSGETDLVVDVELTIGTRPSGAAVIDSIAGAGSYVSVATPSGFLKPDFFASAALSVDVSKSSLLLVGQYADSATGELPASPRYAALALLIAPKGRDEQSREFGFVMAAALEHWRLSDLSPALDGLDAAIGLQLTRAAVALSSVDASAGQAIARRVPSIPAGMAITPGLNFFVELDFDGGLLKNVASIVSLQGPYTLAGSIPSDATAKTTLKATMGGLTLLSILSFRDIDLVFTIVPAHGETPASRELKLSGNIVATLGDNEYSFTGDLTVTQGNARFRAVTAHSVSNPLGVPALTLDRLGFAVDVDYTANRPSRTSLAFTGQVSFTGGPTLQGAVALQNGAPTILLVRLIQANGDSAQLSVAALFNRVTGLTWPDTLDVALHDGQLWWVPGTEAVTYEGAIYGAGFHGSARATVFFLPEITLDLAVHSEGTATEKGLVATAGFSVPVDWGFIKFSGTQTHGGPTAGPWVSIDTRNATTPFGLGGGDRAAVGGDGRDRDFGRQGSHARDHPPAAKHRDICRQ